MAACDWPVLAVKAGTVSKKTGKKYLEDIYVKCGRCYNCKIARLKGWIFRLQQEEKRCTSSYFITLTYDNLSIPITQNKFMTLNKKHVQLYMKKLRKTQKTPIKYYFVGEYGGQTKRPHYHAIIFNVESEIAMDECWEHGLIDIGYEVQHASIAYCLEYIGKPKIVPEHDRDDRAPEFSLFSKGLGKEYISQQVKQYYRQFPDQMYITDLDGLKIPMPRYYRELIWDSDQREEQGLYIAHAINDKDIKDRKEYKGTLDYDENLRQQKMSRLSKLKSKSKKQINGLH